MPNPRPMGTQKAATPFELRHLLAIILSVALSVPANAGAWPWPPATAAQQPPQAQGPRYRIEILSAAAKPTRRRQNMISSESVIRVTDSNDRPVAGVAVVFSVNQLSGGSATFANGTGSSFMTTNAAGVASTGPVTASPNSTFNIGVSASVSGETVTATIPVSMAQVAAAAGIGAAGAGAGAAGGVSGALIGVLAAVGAAAAVVAVRATGGDGNGGTGGGVTPPPPVTNPRIRIGGPGTPTITAPQP